MTVDTLPESNTESDSSCLCVSDDTVRLSTSSRLVPSSVPQDVDSELELLIRYLFLLSTCSQKS